MDVDIEYKNPSYLYGQILAIYNEMEKTALYKREQNQSLVTEYMKQDFVRNAYYVISLIDCRLASAKRYIGEDEMYYYDNLLQQVYSRFESLKDKQITRLDDNWFIGYIDMKNYLKEQRNILNEED